MKTVHYGVLKQKPLKASKILQLFFLWYSADCIILNIILAGNGQGEKTTTIVCPVLILTSGASCQSVHESIHRCKDLHSINPNLIFNHL